MLDTQEEARATHTADRILHELASPIPYEDTAVRANASIGIACAEPGDDSSSLLRSADLAMYAAKHDGKGTWKCYRRPELEAGAIPPVRQH